MIDAIGQGVNALAGIGTAIYGGVKAGKERKKMEDYLSTQEANNESWYNANALSDYTQRADAQALMSNLRENLAKQNKAVANQAIVTGATPEQLALQKEQANKAISDTYSNLGAMGQQWKDNITNRYLARKDAFAGQRMNMMEATANSYENLMSNGLNSLKSSTESASNKLLM